MTFKQFLQIQEAPLATPALNAVNQKVGATVANQANAPSNQAKTAGDVIKGSLLDVAKKDPASVDALTNAVKGPVKPGQPMMMKKKMKGK